MKYDKILTDCYNIYTIKTDKFKTCHMEIVFRNKCDKDFITYSALLFDVLMENCEEYSSKKLLARRLQELYNLSVYAVNSRVGNMLFSNVVADFLDPVYMDKDSLEEIIKLTFDMIFRPNVCNDGFDEETFNTVKRRLQKEIEAVKESPKQLSIMNAFKTLDEASPRSFNSCGDAEILKDITPKKLYQFYKKVLEESIVDIYIIGNIDSKQIEQLITKYSKFNSIKTQTLPLYLDEINVRGVKEKSETKDISQLQLVQIYSLANLDSFECNYVMPIFNMLWGSGSLESKVYKSLRGENALCYNVVTYYQKYDRTLILHTAIDKEQEKYAMKLIKSTLESMSKGEITSEELQNVISIMINSLNIIYDSPSRLIDNYLFSNIADLPNIEDRIEEYKKVTIEDLIRVSKKIKLVLNYKMGGYCEKD